MTCAPPLATPAAMVPTPASLTSLTLMLALRLAFSIVDQLCQILDGVDIVVGRGRDQAHAGGAVAGLGDPRIHLGTGQIAALTGLCALCQLDLDLFRETRYLLVTPKRAEATCLILELLSLW